VVQSLPKFVTGSAVIPAVSTINKAAVQRSLVGLYLTFVSEMVELEGELKAVLCACVNPACEGFLLPVVPGTVTLPNHAAYSPSP
jgi:hypothetical protein